MSTIYRAIFRMMIFAALILTASEARAGFLYVLNQQNGAPNQIYGYAINEGSGGLTLLSGFPVSSGGNGIGSTGSGQMTVDRANQRLYVVNDGSNTVSAFSIDPNSGQLTAMPFSPITLPAGTWFAVAVHPTGSPLITGGDTGVASFRITATSATPASVPASTGTLGISSATFSRDGNFLYAGGGGANTFAGFSVNSSTGVLTALPGSPFNSGSAAPSAYATDSKGRLFMANALDVTLRAFTTSSGVPTGVTGNPFASGVTLSAGGAMHPNERFYYVADRSVDRVGAFEIAGNGAATTLTAVAGSPFNSGGDETNALAFNGNGGILFATNSISRNITTYGFNSTSGALIFDNVQPVNTLGASGTITGIAVMPTVFTVKNANDSGADSLRQLVSIVGSVNSGAMIVFDREFFSVPRTISQAGGQISINTHLNIIGPGAHLLTVRNTAAPGPSSRVFNVGAGVNVTLSGLTITGGNVTGATGGGGIHNEAFSTLLLIRDCVITGNTSAGLGGGIKANAVLNILNSTISGNSSLSGINGGGGIDSGSTLFLTNSTVSGNIKTGAPNSGGGIWAQTIATITNSTITNNLTTGAGGAGGMFLVAGTFTVRNNIIAGNVNNTTVPDVRAIVAPGAGGFNLIGNVGTASGFNQTGDQAGTGASPLDPRLVKVLAFKGGTTPVHMPLPTSPAVDKGSSFGIRSDQRGSLRPFDNGSIPNTDDAADIGAVERNALESIFTAPFDFDGDGKTDVGIFRLGAEWWISHSSTGATFATQFGSGSIPIAPADFTGDGKCDIAQWREANGTWFVLRSEDFSFFAFPFGADGDVAVPADYDGDAKADAAVFRPSAATWFISNSSGGTTILQFGAGNDRPVPADYDGDGKTDIAIYRPSNGQWWINRSAAGVIAVTFGISSDKQVQGDYTGDGKADVAFWRPSTGEWFVLRSDDFSFFSFPFGVSTDRPAPGDYDGDGKHDATVFRPSNGTWFSERTSAGTLIQQFGTTNDRPIPNAFVR